MILSFTKDVSRTVRTFAALFGPKRDTGAADAAIDQMAQRLFESSFLNDKVRAHEAGDWF